MNEQLRKMAEQAGLRWYCQNNCDCPSTDQCKMEAFARLVAMDCIREMGLAADWCNKKMVDALRAKYGVK